MQQGSLYKWAKEHRLRLHSAMLSNDSSSQAADRPHPPAPETLPSNADALLAALALRMRRSLSSSEVLQATVADVRRFFAAERVILCRFSAEWRGMVVMESASPGIPSILGTEIDDRSAVHDWVDPYLEGTGRAITDLTIPSEETHDLSNEHRNFLTALQARSCLIMPILQDCQQVLKLGGWAASAIQDRSQQAQLWGLLVVQHCSAPRQWQVAQMQVLEQLSILVAIAIRQGDLYSVAQAELIKRQRADAEKRRLKQVLQQRQQSQPALQHTLQQEIAQRHHLEAVLAHEQSLAQVTLQAVRDAVITVDLDGEIQTLNPVAERLTGWSTAEAQSHPLMTVFQVVDEASRQPLTSPLDWPDATEYRLGLLLNQSGSEHLIDIVAMPIQNQDGQPLGTVVVFNDVTQSRQLEQNLSWHATHDSLTQIMNRRTFEQKLLETLSIARGTDQQSVLCCINLDQFKIINETCGHVAGDQLLRQVTDLLKQRIRSTDILARLSGDEFGLLLHQCSLEQATQMANELRERLQETPFKWQGQRFNVSASIGLVSIDADLQDAPMALSAADAACFVAKQKGRNNLHIYHSTDQELLQQRNERQWVARIHKALEEDRFCLYSQPIRPLITAHPDIHCEVLLRLVESDGELVLPMNFIPAAERYDLMPMIDRWVIETFCRHYPAHQSTSKSLRCLYNINLSGTSLNSHQFLTFLQEQLAQYQIPPATICFEITETAAISDLDQAAQFTQSLRQLGCSFALDDFGRGMSSLAYLKNLPVDYLKIDGGFIKQLVSSHTDAAIVDCFNHLSHELGIATIAECVENDITLKKLKSMGVDYVQGFGIAKPLPLKFSRVAST
jgi:diguanylate cyclase (GGDEF)-like protein/PAS domain S-box-containing protein